jgi:hypothetical protein
MRDDDDDYLKTPAAAKVLLKSESTLEKLRVTVGGPPYSKVGNTVLYRRGDLREYVRKRLRTSTSDKIPA